MLRITGKLLAFLSLNLALPTAFAERILIDDAEQRVVLTQALDCYSTAEIRIEAARPELFEGSTQGLQRVADAVRAMLYYECPEVSEIKMQGMLRGLQEPVFNGRSSRRDNWLVQTLPVSVPRDIALLLDGIQAGEQAADRHTSEAFEPEGLSLARMHLGMSLEQVSKTIREHFDARPVYDARQGVMTLNWEHCPGASEQRPGIAEAGKDWKCIEARFSDRRLPELEQLHIVQLARNDRYSVQQLLVEYYGVPSGQHETSPNGTSELSWSSGEGDILEAVLNEMENGHTLTELRLIKAGLPVAGKRMKDSGLVL